MKVIHMADQNQHARVVLVLTLVFNLLLTGILACSSSGTNGSTGSGGSGGGSGDGDGPSPIANTSGEGQILYSLADVFYLISATSGATPASLATRFDSAGGSGEEDKMNISRDGTYVVVSTTRLGCSGNPCLARFNTDGSAGEKVNVGGSTEVNVYGNTMPAISPDGATIVVPQQNGSRIDLYATTRSAAGVWSALTLLTGDSPYTRNQFATISADGTFVAFSCGDTDDETDHNNLCEVGIDGNNYQVLIVAGSGNSFTNTLRPTYANNGDLIFEVICSACASPSDGERIWRLLAARTSDPTPIGDFNNEVGPCALPNGEIATLYLGGSLSGEHELNLENSDGSNKTVLLSEDIDDIGLGCSE